MITTVTTTEYYCDGPQCEVAVTTNTDPTQPPTGWLKAAGPSQLLGEFHFHSGACYDRWRLNVENHLAMLNSEAPNG